MRKEKLLEQLKSVKAPEPDEETVLRSEEELIEKVRISFPQIVQERRMIRMKHKKFVLAVVSMAVVAVVLSVVVVPGVRIASAKQVAKDVIAKEMHATVDDKEMVVNGNTVSAVAMTVEVISKAGGKTERTVKIEEVTIDTKTHKIVKSSPAEPVSLTEEEKNKVIEIFRNSPGLKKFPMSPMVPPMDSKEEAKYIDLSKATIVNVKGYAFPDGKEKSVIGEFQSDLLPKGAVGNFVVNLQKGEIGSISIAEASIITNSSDGSSGTVSASVTAGIGHIELPENP